MSTPATVTDLAAGDRLVNIGGVGFAQFADPAAPPVLVCEVRVPEVPAELVQIITSAGTLYSHPDAPVAAHRDDTVRADTVLLIGRRRSLHATLLGFGIPVIRRTPLADESKPAVTAAEWQRAPLIVIDGYLAQGTLRNLWLRGDLTDRTQIVMVCDDPDDTRSEARSHVAHARGLAQLPYDRDGLADLFAVATGAGGSRNPYVGILTPPTGSLTS